jgi:hypothetical protein
MAKSNKRSVPRGLEARTGPSDVAAQIGGSPIRRWTASTTRWMLESQPQARGAAPLSWSLDKLRCAARQEHAQKNDPGFWQRERRRCRGDWQWRLGALKHAISHARETLQSPSLRTLVQTAAPEEQRPGRLIACGSHSHQSTVPGEGSSPGWTYQR